MINQFLTVKEIAKALQVSEVFVYKLARQGKIPSYHLEKCLRFDPSEIHAWIETKRGLKWNRDKREKPC